MDFRLMIFSLSLPPQSPPLPAFAAIGESWYTKRGAIAATNCSVFKDEFWRISLVVCWEQIQKGAVTKVCLVGGGRWPDSARI